MDRETGLSSKLQCLTFSPNFADSTRGSAIFAGQVIERQGVPRARTPKIGCSADQVYSHGRQYADNWRPSCSCAAKFAGRMASNTATGAFVENTRVAGGRVAQRHVLYLGEIN